MEQFEGGSSCNLLLKNVAVNNGGTRGKGRSLKSVLQEGMGGDSQEFLCGGTVLSQFSMFTVISSLQEL